MGGCGQGGGGGGRVQFEVSWESEGVFLDLSFLIHQSWIIISVFKSCGGN